MAGEPAPLAAVQAAVLKTAAAKQGQGEAPAAAGSSQATAVSQDLALMADQSKGYAAGVNQGVIVAQDNRASQARRLAEEAAQAQAAQARQLQADQAQTESMRLRGQAAAQQDRFASEREVAQQRLARAAREESPEDMEAEEIGEKFRQIEFAAVSRQKPAFAQVFEQLTGQASNRKDIMALFDNLKAQSGDPLYSSVSRDAIDRYARVWEAASANKNISLDSLDMPARAATTASRQQLERTIWQAIQSQTRPQAASIPRSRTPPWSDPAFDSPRQIL